MVTGAFHFRKDNPVYRPRISQLIERLEGVKERHGDVECIGYSDAGDVHYDQIDAEFNDDDGEDLCLVTVDRPDED